MTAFTLSLMTGAAAALWYGAYLTHRPVSALRSAVKTLSTAALAVAAMGAQAPLLIVAALMLGAVGDYFLSRDPKAGFLPGLASFLLGHVCYLVWGAGALRAQGLAAPPDLALWLDIAVFLGLVAYVLRKLWPHLADMRIPVAAYTGISAALGIVALFAAESAGGRIFALGAGAFILSDVILAFQLFVMPERGRWVRRASVALWALYWTGQATLLWGVIVWVQLPA